MPTNRCLLGTAGILTLGILLAGCSHKKPPVVTPITAKLPPDNLQPPPFQTPNQKIHAAVERWRFALMSQSVTSSTPTQLTAMQAIIRSSVAQPSVQSDLKLLANYMGVSTSQMRSYWEALQAADLFLESGDDANAVSSVGACGVAQWMPESALRVGLKVNLKESNALSADITALQRPAVKAVNAIAGLPGKNPAIDSSSQSSSNVRSVDTNSTIAKLQAKRASIDQRFNPELAIFAQTRYLLSLVRKFPSTDWLFQAYHGGEGGVTRLLRLYSKEPGASPASIILGDKHHSRTSFADVYLNCSPKHHVRAFDYLYSRGDDDRHYWWKILAATEIIPGLIAQRLAPGSIPPTLLRLWYGRNEELYRFQGDNMVIQGLNAGVLVPSPCTPTTCQYTPSASHVGAPPSLRPIAAEALKLIMYRYHAEGGLGLPTVNITTGASAPGPGQSGLGFQLLFPKDKRDLLVMTYVLERLTDQALIGLGRAVHEGPPHWIVLPCPYYGQAISRLVIGQGSTTFHEAATN